MGNINEVLRKLENGINKGFYKAFRLTHLNGEIITTYKRDRDAITQLNYIRTKLHEMPDGKYLLKASCDKYNKDVTTYELIKSSEPEIIENKNLPIEQIETAESMNNIDFEEYLQLVRENEKLKAQLAILQTQLDMQKEFYEKAKEEKGLSEPSPLAQALESIAPSALGLLEKYLMIQEDKTKLEREKLGAGKLKGKILKRPAQPKKETAPTYEEILLDCQNCLNSGDETKLNQILDFIELNDINTYNRLINELGLEEEEEEETTNE